MLYINQTTHALNVVILRKKDTRNATPSVRKKVREVVLSNSSPFVVLHTVDSFRKRQSIICH